MQFRYFLPSWFLPVCITDVRLVHHVIPFAAGESVVVVIREFCVLLVQIASASREVVRAGVIPARIPSIFCHRDVELGDDSGSFHGIQNELVKRVARF